MDNPIHKNIGLGYALLHFYLYSSFHIAICAVAITSYSYFTLSHQIIDYHYIRFVGASTLLLYSLHRIIGINKSDSYATKGRFAIIIKYKSHLIIYSIVSALYCLYTFYTFDWNRKLLLAIPAALSLSYSLPIFIGGKRLRDFHFIKIFLIATCWALITCTIPYYESIKYQFDIPHNYRTIFLATIDRGLFIFAITIPFDIRDRDVDKSNNVQTLATKFSDKSLKRISLIALIVATIISMLLYTQDAHSTLTLLPIILTYTITSFLVYVTHQRRSDYFFTGLLDSTMILPLILFFLYVSYMSI